MAEEQAVTLVTSAAQASGVAGGSNAPQRLARNMRAAMGKQRAACRQAEEQAEEAKQTEAKQLAELHQPRVHSPSCCKEKGCSLFVCVCHKGSLIVFLSGLASHS